MNWIFISLAMVTIFTPIGIYRRLKRLATDVAKGRNQLDRLVKQRDNLNFGLSSSDSEGFTQQISGFFAKSIAEGAIAEKKSTRDANKVPEGEGEKLEVRVDKLDKKKPIEEREDELQAINNRIGFLSHSFNDTVELYNLAQKQFLAPLFATSFGHKQQEFFKATIKKESVKSKTTRTNSG